MSTKKAQEEMVGFVIIVLIIIIVGIIFLGFSIRQNKSQTQKQQEITDLTWAILSYTTNCSVNEQKDVWGLIKTCDTNPSQLCDNGLTTCSSLNSTLRDILKNLIGTNANLVNRSIHAYSFNIAGHKPTSNIKITQGNTSGSFFDYYTFIPTDINLSMRFYYS
jgi:hypothetical protein